MDKNRRENSSEMIPNYTPHSTTDLGGCENIELGGGLVWRLGGLGSELKKGRVEE